MNLPSIQSTVSGSGKPLVILHAFPLSHLIWEGFKAPPGFSLILPDFPGFGTSPMAKPGLTLEAAAQGLETHLQELKITDPIVLGGISMGGYWAMEYLRLFPARVAKLLFISTRPGLDKPEGRQNRLNMADKVLRDGTEYLVLAMTPGLLGKTTLADKPELVIRIGQWIRDTKPEAVALAQRAMADRRDQTNLLPGLRVPTLVMAGREDALIPASEAESMAQAIPGSRLKVLDKVGHLIPLEEPAAFQKIVDEFVTIPG